jgi:hypothetical protein
MMWLTAVAGIILVVALAERWKEMPPMVKRGVYSDTWVDATWRGTPSRPELFLHFLFCNEVRGCVGHHWSARKAIPKG